MGQLCWDYKSNLEMAIAQMNWGRMLRPPDHPSMQEFTDSLAPIYTDAEGHEGFVWRISDDEAGRQLQSLGFDLQTSATISIWDNVGALYDYTFKSRHGEYLKRRHEWFDNVSGPQLVIWPVESDHRPDFQEAFDRLAYLTEYGPTDYAYGWPDGFE